MNSTPSKSRRQFLHQTMLTSATGAAAMAHQSPSSAFAHIAGNGEFKSSHQDSNLDASELIKGKDKRLIVLKPDPAVFETPLKLLYEKPITPSRLLFVRNNQQPKEMSTLDPVSNNDWRIRVQDQTINVSQLKELPQSSVTMVLQCSGNGRSLFSEASRTKGTQWGKGGMGCVQVAGVRLKDVLQKLKIEPGSKDEYLLAEGVDKPLPDKEDFLHTLPLAESISRSFLALSLNGKPLPAIHGGPVRLITPGVFATMHIKWLGSLRFVENESENYNHVPRYRVPKSSIKPGLDYQFTLANSNFNWNMKVKTVVLNIENGQKSHAGIVPVQGVAFNDGSASIETVLVSANRGESWKQAKLEKPDGRFAWTRFETSFKLPKGRTEIWTRAVDSLGRSQPLNGAVAWNPRGYEWNGVEKIQIELI